MGPLVWNSVLALKFAIKGKKTKTEKRSSSQNLRLLNDVYSI